MEITGCTLAGKTQLCHCIALLAAVDHSCDVMFVESGGSFSSKRLLQLATAKCVKDQSWQRYVHSAPIFDLFELTDLLEDVLISEKSSPPARMMIVDCLTSLLAGHHADDLIEAKRYVAHLLKRIALEQSMAIVYTNNLVMEGSCLAMSSILMQVPNTRINLSSYTKPSSDVDLYSATLLKSSHRSYGLATAMTLDDAGFQDIAQDKLGQHKHYRASLR
ncbi:DNA repair protein RAD51 homolog 4-like [Sycon ciliatum]|uniref:DNA repair protein RAD51 homolog 4-like n=1 Tax=Sycon ciliatum TaxID=27933 RepID=UPI0031F6E48C